MNMERILVIVAHADDETLGCGGLCNKLIKNNKIIRVLLIGTGPTAKFDKKDIYSIKAKNKLEERYKYLEKALHTLGIYNYNLGKLFCGRFENENLIDIGKMIEKEINIFKPDTILTHSNIDVHVDHRIVNQAVLQATRPGVFNFVKNILMCEIPSNTEWKFIETFQPNYFVNIENEIDTKIKAFCQYKTERKDYPFPRSEEGLRTLSMCRGMQSGMKYAEAYEIVRILNNG